MKFIDAACRFIASLIAVFGAIFLATWILSLTFWLRNILIIEYYMFTCYVFRKYWLSVDKKDELNIVGRNLLMFVIFLTFLTLGMFYRTNIPINFPANSCLGIFNELIKAITPKFSYEASSVVVFNFFEGVVWLTISLVLALKAFYSFEIKKYMPSLILGSFYLACFGISDFIEMRTGVWWKPVSLLILKGICILGMVICLFRHYSIPEAGGVRH